LYKGFNLASSLAHVASSKFNDLQPLFLAKTASIALKYTFASSIVILVCLLYLPSNSLIKFFVASTVIGIKYCQSLPLLSAT
jgi:hypothetical protein